MNKVEEKFEENKTKNKKIKVPCIKCNGKTSHKIMQSLDYSGCEWIARDYTIDWIDNYQIIQCQGCESVSFRHKSWFSEYQDYDSDGSTEWLYPKRTERTLPIKNFRNVPTKVRRIYGETIECFNNEFFTLCAAGLRAIVEGICAQQGIKDGPVEVEKRDGTKKLIRRKDLQGKISGLCEKGILTTQNSEILHEHRFLGNEAVHELSQPSMDELNLAIEIIEHTIDSLYEIPEKAIELQKKKAKRRKKT